MMKRPSPPEIETDLIIIGAGVSGLKLAEVLLDSNIKFWLLGSPYESQLAKAGVLEDTPLPEGTIGLKFIETKFQELKDKNIQHRSSICTGIEPINDKFRVKTKFQDFICNYIVIATGNKQKSLGFDGEAEYFRKGISDCTVCDYPLYREKPVAVLGNHKYTIRAAKLMKQYSSSVALLWYKSNGAPELDGIDVYNQVENLQASGDETLDAISFDFSNGKEKLQVKGLFVEGTPIPSTNFLGDLSLALQDGYIKIDEKFQTSFPNVWAVGDITGKSSNYEEANNAAVRLGQILTEVL